MCQDIFKRMARPTGFEPVAPRLGKRSYFVWGFPSGNPHPILTFLDYGNRLTSISMFSPPGKEKSPLPKQGSCLR